MSLETEVQDWLDQGIVPITDIEHVRTLMKKPEGTPQKIYDNLTRLIAEIGCLYMPFRDLPEVKQLLED